MRRIEQRPRPARRGAFDLAQRIAALFRVGRDHDRDVMVRQRHRQFDALDDIERQEFDTRMLEQELDRRVAAHVHRRRECKHAQLRLRRRTGRAEQLMEGQHLGLDGKPGLLLAKQLRNEREVEPLARCRRPVGDLRDDLVAQRAQVGAAERHSRKPGKTYPVGPGIGRRIAACGTCNPHNYSPFDVLTHTETTAD